MRHACLWRGRGAGGGGRGRPCPQVPLLPSHPGLPSGVQEPPSPQGRPPPPPPAGGQACLVPGGPLLDGPGGSPRPVGPTSPQQMREAVHSPLLGSEAKTSLHRVFIISPLRLFG